MALPFKYLFWETFKQKTALFKCCDQVSLFLRLFLNKLVSRDKFHLLSLASWKMVITGAASGESRSERMHQ